MPQETVRLYRSERYLVSYDGTLPDRVPSFGLLEYKHASNIVAKKIRETRIDTNPPKIDIWDGAYLAATASSTGAVSHSTMDEEHAYISAALTRAWQERKAEEKVWIASRQALTRGENG